MKKEFKNEIINHAKEFPQEEVCGALILTKFDGPKIVRLKNYHEDKQNFFRVDPKEFISLKRKGDILALYHSHPDAKSTPSAYDKKISKELCVPFYIYSLLEEDFYLFVPDTYQPDLMGRVYVEDVLNCAMFAKNYYEQKFGMKCGYKQNFFEVSSKKSANLRIIKGITSSGFEEIDKNDIKKDDLIVFKAFSEDQYFHLGIYNGEGEFFHHEVNCLSKTDIFDQIHQRLVYKVYRYKGK